MITEQHLRVTEIEMTRRLIQGQPNGVLRALRRACDDARSPTLVLLRTIPTHVINRIPERMVPHVWVMCNTEIAIRVHRGDPTDTLPY